MKDEIHEKYCMVHTALADLNDAIERQRRKHLEEKEEYDDGSFQRSIWGVIAYAKQRHTEMMAMCVIHRNEGKTESSNCYHNRAHEMRKLLEWLGHWHGDDERAPNTREPEGRTVSDTYKKPRIPTTRRPVPEFPTTRPAEGEITRGATIRVVTGDEVREELEFRSSQTKAPVMRHPVTEEVTRYDSKWWPFGNLWGRRK